MHSTIRKAAAPCAVFAMLALLGGCTLLKPPLDVTPEIRAAVAAPDRSAEDRKTDERRHPELLLAFAGVRPGMKVLDIGAGAGYSTEILARGVGARGLVYGQNSAVAMERIKNRFDDRFAKFALKNVTKVVRDDVDPVPPNAGAFDMVTIFFFYHDIPWLGVDRALLTKRIYDALKPGGVVVVADHAAKAGDGVSVSRSLHRIEESVVKSDFEGAGFRFAGDADFLRNPKDPRDAPVFRSPIQVDEFVLKFVKPQ
jgi:predicted methyltransferase